VADLVEIKVERPSTVTVFCPWDARKTLKLESKRKMNFFTPTPIKNELKFTVKYDSQGEHTTFVPLLYVVESGGVRMVKMVPVLIPEETRGWEFPIYHYRHKLSREYLLPFLWYVYPKRHAGVFDIPLPFPRERVCRGNSFIQEGIFYWVPSAREEWSETMLAYNFTGEKAELLLISGGQVEVVKLPPDSKIFLETKSPPEMMVAVGPCRLEWFPII